MDTQFPYSFWVAEVSTSVSTSTSPKRQRSPRADGQNVQAANQLELAPNSLHISSTKINTNCPWPTVFTNPQLFITTVSPIQLRAKDAPIFKTWIVCSYDFVFQVNNQEFCKVLFFQVSDQGHAESHTGCVGGCLRVRSCAPLL